MTSPIIERGNQSNLTLWAAAVAVAALGTWLMFEAKPGINWGIWTATAAALLVLFARQPNRSAVIAAGLTAAVIGFGAAVTTNPFMQALICIAVIMFMALAMLLSIDARLDRLTAAFVIPAPIVAFSLAVVEAAQRAVQALHVVRSNRARSVLRGIAITVPVVAVFALLLASADPVFAEWRSAIDRILSSWSFLPRTIFFLGLLTIVVGAYGFAASEQPVSGQPPTATKTPRRWLGSTERLILLSSVAALFWTFLAIQLSYLFGNAPSITGSGMTFAEYARRGFAELTIVASASVFLILFCERFAEAGQRRGLLRTITLLLIVAVVFLLGSAFHRVSLYEEAYGFTTSRLYAQVYMIVVAVALVALAIEVGGEVQASRLFRRTAAAATLAFIVLVYWNHEGWIANRNIDRLAASGRLDITYLTRELSPGAVPTLVARLSTLPEPARTELRNALALRYGTRRGLLEDRWLEWNAGRASALEALRAAGMSVEYATRSPVQPAVRQQP